jgi:hypothetical protein
LDRLAANAPAWRCHTRRASGIFGRNEALLSRRAIRNNQEARMSIDEAEERGLVCASRTAAFGAKPSFVPKQHIVMKQGMSSRQYVNQRPPKLHNAYQLPAMFHAR